MKALVLGLIFLSLQVFATTAPFSPFTTDKLFVKLQPQEQLPASEYIVKSKRLFGDLYLITTSNVILLEKELKELPEVSYTQKNYIRQKSLGKRTVLKSRNLLNKRRSNFNDKYLNKQWSLADDSGYGISMLPAYNDVIDGEPTETVIVAVVDTGVEYTHEDLKDVMWVNEGEIAGNGIDDDNNGYVDDIHGINTIDRVDGIPTGDITDGHGHGTHVSGTIGASQNNGLGIAGIASDVKIMGIRTVPNSSDETDVNVVESFLYAADMGAKIINCSFGKAVNEGGLVVNETIDHIGQNHDVLVVAAAGNDSKSIDKSPAYPASFTSEYLLVVASSSKSWGGSLSYFSNYGPVSVDLGAPGSDIYSTVTGNSYASYSGTSMASPTTAGVAAQVRSMNPQMDALAVKNLLMDTVTEMRRFKGKMIAPGRVNLKRALETARNN